ncbi:META domain-containing protein [Acinetobacter sp. V89_7]|uniref:META domain-containing protein n=1 Tax=Acinetobacter sp. V89_7 TaxID=3044233 RepID=UPI00249F6150|nr:META domain-containing protein [Acinetobacter sp. V89_7]MDI3379471.1 META domain-containing protein [Acinetobacter sp. V89_7]
MIKTWLTGTCLCASVLFTGCAVTPSTSSTDSTTKTAVTSSSSANASTANVLLDRNWTATEINGFQISTQVANKPSLKFDSKTQRFSGTDGCNRMMGSFKADAESLQLGAAASTKMICPNTDQNISVQYQQALTNVSRYRVSPEHLILMDQSGRIVMALDASK